MMPRFMPAVVVLGLGMGVGLSGCANPADDEFKVTATAPKPVPAATPEAKVDVTPAATPATSKGPDNLTATGSPAAATAPVSGTLEFTGQTSKVEFTGSKVTGSHSGGFKTFTGTAGLTPDGSSLASLTADIDTASTWSDNEKLTGHLKAPDFFDVTKYPKATFVTTEIKPGGEKGATHAVTGNLTLHGVTKSITFPATVVVKDGSATLTTSFALNRKDFGIAYAGMTNDLIRDEVVIKLDLKAAKKS